jgi:hypothetical protein
MKKLWNSTFSIAAPLVLLALFAGSAQTCLAATPGHDSSQVTPGPGIPPDPWEWLQATPGPGIPPDPWEWVN